MDANAYVNHARAVMREHGYYVQAVAPAAPGDARYCYTVGLQRLRVPRPEVIVFGFHGQCAQGILQAVYERVRRHGALTRGQIVTGLFDDCPRRPVRIEEVRPEWVQAYAGMAPLLLRRGGSDVPMLQLVLADDAGRWPEDPDVDRGLLADQPLLSQALPWQAPFVRDPVADLFFDEQPGTVLVAAAVHGPVLPDGRYELLRAVSLRPGAARISDVPLLADHVAVGDVVQLCGGDGVPGLPEKTAVMGTVLEAGGWQTMAFGLACPSADAVRAAQLADVLWDLHGSGRTRLATGLSTLHVNTSEPAAVEADIRPFVRDGLLRPIGLRSQADPFGPSMDDCPDCQAARRARPGR